MNIPNIMPIIKTKEYLFLRPLLYKPFPFLLLFLTLIGCQQYYLMEPTRPSEASLVADSFENGMSAELNIGYLQAFENLKQAYRYCIVFSQGDKFVYTDNRLEDHLEMATLFARTPDDGFLHKTTIEGLGPHKSRLTLYVPSNYPFAKTRFKADIHRALGIDAQCNRN